jgi:predicted nucleotidyltransferase
MNANSFQDLLTTLQRGNVEFILIGGLAGMAQGSARATVAVDVVYARNRSNLARIEACLASSQPYLRGAPRGLPFRFDVETMQRGLNFTLTTNIGDLDLLGEVPGGGTYDLLKPHSELLKIFEVEVMCVTLEKLIDLKRAAGRPKDLEAIAELEALLEERNNS